MNEKETTFVYMRIPEPDRKEPRLELETGTFWLDFVYDKEKRIAFKIMKEPPWIHMEKDITYEIEFSMPNDDNYYDYRLYKRLTDDIVIVAEYYNNKFITTDEKYLSDNWTKMPIEDYVLDPDIEISERKLGEGTRHTSTNDEYWDW